MIKPRTARIRRIANTKSEIPPPEDKSNPANVDPSSLSSGNEVDVTGIVASVVVGLLEGMADGAAVGRLPLSYGTLVVSLTSPVPLGAFEVLGKFVVSLASPVPLGTWVVSLACPVPSMLNNRR